MVVRLVPVALYDEELLGILQYTVEGIFEVEVRIESLEIDLAAAYDPSRNQYNAELLLKQAIPKIPMEDKALLIVDVDIFVPIFTFVFGLAQLGGRVGIVSTWRLRPEVYGEPEDRGLFLARALKEALHELGHLWGLEHCFNPGCVMNFSPSIEYVDEKDPAFCETCLARIRGGGRS